MSKSLPVKQLFDLPEGVIYLDGNSLGALPKAASVAVKNMIEAQWGQLLIKGWNQAGWMDQPSQLGDRIGRLIGAESGTVTTGDTLSIKVFQALSAALEMRSDRKLILSDTGNFPTDLYMAQGLIDALDRGHQLKTVAPESVLSAIDEQVAVVMLTHVDYRTGRMHDMQAITEAAHKAGAVMIWDLAHSAGAVPVDLMASSCEFAVGCTYKYVNAGPGAPAFIYVRPDVIETVNPSLAGWLGHDKPFAFEPGYRPAPSIERMRVGTPPVLQMASLSAALDIWDQVNMADIRSASIELSELFIAEVERRCPMLALASPRRSAERGSQVSFRFENGYAAMQAIIDRGVIGDFRAPDIMRFGFTPLYLDTADILKAVDVIDDVLTKSVWKEPQYQVVKAVT